MAAKQHENPLDTLVDFCVDRLSEIVDAIPEDIPPFGSQKLTTEEQLERYAEIREDPQAWAKLADAHGLRGIIEYGVKMEALHQARVQDHQKEAERDARRISGGDIGASA
ncbi:MAG TPA: hypothetical protein VMX14_06115 [Anaerolineae bacterium]|nr:hypothetical protein [Anaerolineae bacterium]